MAAGSTVVGFAAAGSTAVAVVVAGSVWLISSALRNPTVGSLPTKEGRAPLCTKLSARAVR